MTRKTQYVDLTADQWIVLRRFAGENGRRWKAALLTAWMNGGTSGELQRLRNTHGPSWLARFRLPKLEACNVRPGDMAALYAEETGLDYATALVHCNMD
jgi:hypothetical protein